MNKKLVALSAVALLATLAVAHPVWLGTVTTGQNSLAVTWDAGYVTSGFLLPTGNGVLHADSASIFCINAFDGGVPQCTAASAMPLAAGEKFAWSCKNVTPGSLKLPVTGAPAGKDVYQTTGCLLQVADGGVRAFVER